MFFQSFMVIIPVIVPYWQSHGLSLQQVFTLQAVFGGALILFDLPAGYCADWLGRKKMLCLGSFISALGFLYLCFGKTFVDFIIYEIIVGLGLSLQSGCDVAILFNSLESSPSQYPRRKYLGWRLTSLTIGEGLASMAGGALAAVSLDLPVLVNAGFAWIPFLITLTVVEPGGFRLGDNKEGLKHWSQIKEICNAIFLRSRWLRLILLNFVVYSFSTYCAVWSLQVFWKERGLPISFFGILWAVNSFLTAILSQWTHRLEQRWGVRRLMMLISILPLIGYFGMSYSLGYYGLVFSLAFPISRAINQILFQDIINSEVPAKMRATVNSIGSLGMRALFLVFGPFLGFIIDHRGVDFAMASMGFVFAFSIIFIARPAWKMSVH